MVIIRPYNNQWQRPDALAKYPPDQSGVWLQGKRKQVDFDGWEKTMDF